MSGKTGSAHNLCYFSKLENIKKFSKTMSKHIKNMTLSSQRANISAYELLKIVEENDGVLIPAHCFTPHKSFYGNCTKSLKNIFKDRFDDIFAIELGLSSDTFLADCISELEGKTFITNSDSHSLPKIAREYNKISIENLSYKEIMLALENKNGRKIVANFGLDPKLGKYHRSVTEADGTFTKGVFDRIEEIKDKTVSKSPENRAIYNYQIPLEFVPGLGPKMIKKLLEHFGTEMTVLHKVGYDDIEAVVGKKLAKTIQSACLGKSEILSGGGGKYGKVNIL